MTDWLKVWLTGDCTLKYPNDRQWLHFNMTDDSDCKMTIDLCLCSHFDSHIMHCIVNPNLTLDQTQVLIGCLVCKLQSSFTEQCTMQRIKIHNWVRFITYVRRIWSYYVCRWKKACFRLNETFNDLYDLCHMVDMTVTVYCQRLWFRNGNYS